jgi:putative thioredoxin
METTLATFERDVIEASKQAPVLVDFWAPWCGPCKTLGPMLDKLEREYAGGWRLAKVNSDENPELAAHFQIRSIPHVVAFVDGQPVDQFTGVLPESQLRAFIDALVPDPAEAARRAAAIAAGENRRADAYDHLQTALALDPGYDEARLDLIELMLADDRIDDARHDAELLSPRTLNGVDPRFLAIKTRLDAADLVPELPGAEDLRARIASHPTDLEARFDLASRLIAAGIYEEALEHLLVIVQQDRSFRDDIGRKTMLSVFELASSRARMVAEWRRKLSRTLN